MDKKKVIELIKKGMLYQSKSSHVSSYKEKAYNCFEEAISELQKPDWISVEDELLSYEEEVLVCDKLFPNDIYITRRYDKISYEYDRYGFINTYQVTHWHKIDKLEG